MERLNRYSWPGNIRELENVLERAVILSNGRTLEIEPDVFAAATAERAAAVDSLNPLVREADHLTASGEPESKSAETLESNERNHIMTTLEKTGWVIDGPHGAAKILAMHPNTLRSRMKKLGIARAGRPGRA